MQMVRRWCLNRYECHDIFCQGFNSNWIWFVFKACKWMYVKEWILYTWKFMCSHGIFFGMIKIHVHALQCKFMQMVRRRCLNRYERIYCACYSWKGQIVIWRSICKQDSMLEVSSVVLEWYRQASLDIHTNFSLWLTFNSLSTDAYILTDLKSIVCCIHFSASLMFFHESRQTQVLTSGVPNASYGCRVWNVTAAEVNKLDNVQLFSQPWIQLASRRGYLQVNQQQAQQIFRQ